jgi:hypothetical protein
MVTLLVANNMDAGICGDVICGRQEHTPRPTRVATLKQALHNIRPECQIDDKLPKGDLVQLLATHTVADLAAYQAKLDVQGAALDTGAFVRVSRDKDC